ncbi:murein biosynthesis integral membrane protein MurJ [Oleiagrimonas soli]|uniref:Probable lipid II flippase MurJ n=1 Tax=Oleiagrimonas soli TaxID=1543381 RepID=A0A099CVF3_9GAMM|nr:murein biosynthesis integral membrane protein MurJ [Oleiagrimonas soli]KGI77928.1 membrane protein [Oleiagrimonas soli]MBB6183703.1 putative peptidoglycan lipid II flippase [Oleiagrimonas soli]
MKKSSLLRGVLSFSSVTMLSRVFGLVRDIAINAAFGANAATDAFWVAFRIPNFMRRLFAEGSFSTAFVPVFTEIKETRSHEDLKALMGRVSGTLGGVLLVVTALGIFFAPQVASLFAPGSLDQPHKLDLTIDLLRLTFPFLWFVSLTAMVGGALNSFDRFAMPAFAPVLLNLCMIAGAVWLAPRLQVPIMAMGWAVLAGGVVQLIFLVPSLRRIGLLTRPRWGWRHPDVRRIMRLMLPTLFSSSIYQVNLLLDTVIASFLLTGSQSWLSLSTRFLELPLGVFGVALGTVILPALSRHFVDKNGDGYSRSLDWGLRIALLIALPAMVALLMLSTPLIATLFQHGKFNAFDTHMATLSIMAFVSGLPAFALVKVLLPAFYSRQDTRTPMRISVAVLIANMALALSFIALLFVWWAPAAARQVGWLDGIAQVPGLHMALGIASALSSYLQLALLWHGLRRAGVFQRQPGWLRHLLRVTLACAVMAAVLWLGREHWGGWTTEPTWTRIWRLAAMVAAGATAYAGALFAGGFRLRDLRGA